MLYNFNITFFPSDFFEVYSLGSRSFISHIQMQYESDQLSNFYILNITPCILCVFKFSVFYIEIVFIHQSAFIFIAKLEMCFTEVGVGRLHLSLILQCSTSDSN